MITKFLYHTRKIYFFILLMSLFFSTVAAASSLNRGSVWIGLDISGPFTREKKWNYNFLLQPRFADNRVLLEQTIIRPSIYYQYNPNWSFWFGYDVNPTIPPSTTKVLTEQRIWPQIEFDKILDDRLLLSIRSRFEGRWRSDSNQFSSRFRQRLEIDFLHLTNADLTIDLFDEIFLHLVRADWVSREVFDQNRIFVGLTVPLSQIMKFDLGYLNIWRPRRQIDRIDHILFFSIDFNLNIGVITPIRSI